jgi:hypothetical protein
MSVPTAVAQHPWWSGGQRQYVHFFNWAQGDGHLWDHYPQLTYWACPNIAEAMLLLCVIVSASELLCVHAVIYNLGRDTVYERCSALLSTSGRSCTTSEASQ